MIATGCRLQRKHTGVGDGAGINLTMISPSHSDGAAAFLLGDVGGEHAVAEHSVF